MNQKATNQPIYSLEIDCKGREVTGYEDVLPWCCYGTIEAEGNTLDELMESATVNMVDQDGGDLRVERADESWMQDLIADAFEQKYAN